MASEAYARRQVRHWLNELGIDPDVLAKQYPQLAVGKSGRQRHPPMPHWFLAGIELWVRVVRQHYDGRNKPTITRKNAIRWIAGAAYLPLVEEKDPNKAATFAAASRDAMAFASHIEKQLRQNGFNKMPNKKLLPPWCKDLKQLAASTTLSEPPSKYFSV